MFERLKVVNVIFFVIRESDRHVCILDHHILELGLKMGDFFQRVSCLFGLLVMIDG